ncbi:unnamed protein product, partial [Timema podura]|nr:unnamed protein product [Timema podura]
RCGRSHILDTTPGLVPPHSRDLTSPSSGHPSHQLMLTIVFETGSYLKPKRLKTKLSTVETLVDIHYKVNQISFS